MFKGFELDTGLQIILRIAAHLLRAMVSTLVGNCFSMQPEITRRECREQVLFCERILPFWIRDNPHPFRPHPPDLADQRNPAAGQRA